MTFSKAGHVARPRRRPSTDAAWSRAIAAAVLVASSAAMIHRASAAESDALRAIEAGDCARAGAAINDGLDRGEPSAYRLAGYLYAFTGCVSPDAERAVRFYRKAVELGDAEARRSLGSVDGLGFGVPQDDREAYRWFARQPDGSLRPDGLDAAHQAAYGYAQAVTYVAGAKIRYPMLAHDEGALFVTFHTATRDVAISRRSESGGPDVQHRLSRTTEFGNAIAAAYAEALRIVPDPTGLPDDDVVFEVPWRFARH